MGREANQEEKRKTETDRERKTKAKYQHWEIQVNVIWKVLFLQLFLQLFCKSQISSKEKKLKGENKSERIHCSDTYTGKKKKILVTSKNKMSRRQNPVKDEQIF